MSTIVCGTDFSEQALQAARVAAAWAARRPGDVLRLVHVVEGRSPQAGVFPSRDAGSAEPLDALHALAKTLRDEFAAEVQVAFEQGHVFDRIVAEATACHAELIVVGALGRGSLHGWRLGSTAERIVQHAPVPVLVVRDASPLLEWLGGRAPLAAMTCVDMTFASRAALHWARSLRRIGPCRLDLTYVAWPPAEHPLVRREPARDEAAPWATLERSLATDLHTWASDSSAEAGEESSHVVVNWGRTDSALVQQAAATHPALIIAGTHRRSRVARLWQGSVTRGLLHDAETNVVCVPPAPAVPGDVVPVRRALVALDLSSIDAAVLRFALGLVAREGELHVLHVQDAGADAAHETDARRRLEALVAPLQRVRGTEVHLAVRRGESPHATIVQHAERIAADVICLGMKRHSRAAEIVLGSQSRDVLRMARVPVAIVPEPSD